VNRRDLIPCALILAAFIAAFGLAVHRLPAEMAYAAGLGDQRPPIPQVMPGTLASEGQSRFLPMPGTKPAMRAGASAPQFPASKPRGALVFSRRANEGPAAVDAR